MAKGQTMAEFAGVSLFFFALLFAIIDYGWAFFAKMNIQQAVDDGGRYASTGQETGSGARITSIQNVILNEISIPGVTASDIVICSDLGGCSTTNGNLGAAGGPLDTVTITMTVPMKLLAPIGFLANLFPSTGYTLVSTSTFKNEPFSPTTTD
ncbi:MAG: TadE/TadG family type IV pilus assembly protein [Candidatus Binatus sp.]